MNIKENLSKNLILYRKSFGLTQIELAEKINYSDKAISKWENGDSFPDIATIKKLADFYGIKVDTLLSEPKLNKIKIPITRIKKRAFICILTCCFAWLVAVLFFAFINVFIPSIENTWISFIVAIPVTFLIIFIYTVTWGKKLLNCIFLSVLSWSLITAVYVCLITLLDNPPSTLWELFLIGIPLQCLVLFWFFYKKIK